MIRRLWDRLTQLYARYREPFWYLVVGGLTTVVDFAVYYLLLAVTSWNHLVIYWIAWTAAVLFAFFPNRNLVFCSREQGSILRQFREFVSSRVATLLIGEGLMFLSVDICLLPESRMKLAVQVLIVILNYVFSKLFVFRRQR